MKWLMLITLVLAGCEAEVQTQRPSLPDPPAAPIDVPVPKEPYRRAEEQALEAINAENAAQRLDDLEAQIRRELAALKP